MDLRIYLCFFGKEILYFVIDSLEDVLLRSGPMPENALGMICVAVCPLVSVFPFFDFSDLAWPRIFAQRKTRCPQRY